MMTRTMTSDSFKRGNEMTDTNVSDARTELNKMTESEWSYACEVMARINAKPYSELAFAINIDKFNKVTKREGV